ncbi:hypothetical protein NQZ79_g4695 [Umbelopsis isabellina]|nr:hypothetical protein NQZ79_g4695 [Umbelopsis isabellina]
MSGYDNYGYDGMSGVENSGGGFLETSHYDNQGGNQSQNKVNSTWNVSAVHFQFLANCAHGDSEFRIDNVDVTQVGDNHHYETNLAVLVLMMVIQVTFVGIVRKESEQQTNIAYTLEDGTGSIDVRQWLDQNHEELPEEKEKRAQMMSNYVRVVGRLTQFNNKTHVVAFQIRSITNADEISHHFLEAILTHLQFTKGSAPGEASMDNFTSSAYNAGNFKSNNDQGSGGGIHKEVITVINQFAHLDQGAEINQVVSRLQGKYSEPQVKEAIDFLQNEGHLYATIDEYHVKSADSY